MDGDADLVARVRCGDRQSFDDLYDRYADDVFSMCLLILGDPAVARAAAGTAFALVARTRMHPLTDPSRLRSWLLELARGSALAWSGSPQARSVPVPHGVSAEDMLTGAVVPAPASLRVGLARTFDRAAVAAAEARAIAGRPARPASATVTTARPLATTRVPGDADAGNAGTGDMGTPAAPAKVDLTKAGSAKTGVGALTFTVNLAKKTKTTTRTNPTEAAVTALPVKRADADAATVVGAAASPASLRPPGNPRPLVAPLTSADDPATVPTGHHDRFARPAIAVAASLVLAVAGITTAVNWPGDAGVTTDGLPGVVVASVPAPSATGPGPAGTLPSPRVVPTVAGEFTSRPVGDGNRQDLHGSLAAPAGQPAMLDPVVPVRTLAPAPPRPGVSATAPPATATGPTTRPPTSRTSAPGTGSTTNPPPTTNPPTTQAPAPTTGTAPPTGATKTSTAPPPIVGPIVIPVRLNVTA
jgi:DNA-directed RNA polymerase specialized sigma24 family protein